jgi:hypothetical protein
MKIGVTRSTAAVIVLLTMAGFAVPQNDARGDGRCDQPGDNGCFKKTEPKQIYARPLNSPQYNLLTTEGRAGLGGLTTLKSASAVKKLFKKLVVKEEAKAPGESDRVEAAIAKAKKLVDKGETKTNEQAKKLMAGVDFSKEMIVLVLWETGGPPGGTLNYEVKGDGLNFFVQAPDPDYVWKLRRGSRGKALIYGANFFAIPRDVSVTIEPGQERPWPSP